MKGSIDLRDDGGGEIEVLLEEVFGHRHVDGGCDGGVEWWRCGPVDVVVE